jgi:hypothetical protein
VNEGTFDKSRGKRASSARPISAWITATWVGRGGRKAVAGHADAVLVASVCVHENVGQGKRLALLSDVGRFFAPLACERPSLWVFPAGFLGNDARLDALPPGFPKSAAVVVGRDVSSRKARVVQEAIVLKLDSRIIVTRTATALDQRTFDLGGLRAAVFVCGEVAGSSSSRNLGPFFEGKLLSDPVGQLCGVDILIDVAHRHVRSTVSDGPPSRRMAHQGALERFASGGRGGAILAHHHKGEQTNGRARADASSEWVVFAGCAWIDPQPRHVKNQPEDLFLATDFALDV